MEIEADVDVFRINSDDELFEKLVKLRKDFANKERVLPQMIMAKNTLKEISGRYPLTEEQLKDIGGLGPKKIDKYGEKLISIVKEYVNENNINIIWSDKKRKKIIIDGENRSNKEIAIDMIKNKESLKNIYEDLEISVSTILGYITEYIMEEGILDLNFSLEDFYNSEEEEIIMNICNKIGYDKIGNIKKEAPDFIKYESIRAIILKNFILAS
ncbi:MAG: HRDC domain-containing protein [Sarcina sp.]